MSNKKVLGKFQMGKVTAWKGMTSDNHLGTLLACNPQEMNKEVVKLLAYRQGNSLDSMLSKFPTKMYDSDEDYTWKVVGSTRRNVPLLEARDEDGNVVTAGSPNVGTNTTPFYLVFGEDWFGDGEVIHGHLNEVYPIRVLGNPRFEGSNVVYKVELFNGTSTGIPSERLLAGERFSPEYAPVERELSREVGTVRFSTPVAMSNEFSLVRIHQKVSGSKMGNTRTIVGMPIAVVTADGRTEHKVANTWMFNEEWAVHEQFSDYKNSALAYGVSNRNGNGEYMNFGKSGNVIKTGDGYFRQIEVGSTYYYNKFNLDLLTNATRSLTAGKVDFANRRWIVRTGEGGAIAFHKAVSQEGSGWHAIGLEGGSHVKSVPSELHGNAMSMGVQFVEWMGPNGHVFTIEVDPSYDDPFKHKIMHPDGGTAMSHRFDVTFAGGNEGPNIFKVGVTGQEDLIGFEAGLRNPFTGVKNIQYMSHSEDSATIHKMSAPFGICVLDPTKHISFIPAILQY